MIVPPRRPTAVVDALAAVLLLTAVTTFVAVSILTSGIPVASALPAPTTTTTAVAPPPNTTTTTLAPISIPGHGPGPNPTGPQPGTTSTSIPAPTTTVAPQVISALVRSVQNDLAQLDAITGYDHDKGIVTVNQSTAASADSNVDLAAQAQAQVAAATASAQAALDGSEHRLASLAVALYVRADVGVAAQNADLSDTAVLNRGVVLGILITHGRDEVARGKRLLAEDRAALRLYEERTAAARAAQAAAHETLSKSAVALANAKLAAAGRAVTPTTGTPLPTITGPSALSASELAGWYASTGYQANTTVPMATLAAYYLSSAAAAGLRGDIAFAQSIVETGYFTFPSGGQLLGADNNFAGIGACDSCAHGWRFPTAQTGVAAQIQLLQAYSSSKKFPTPLVGRVSVAGCCPTWLALSGVWATATNYGYAILRVYKEMLDWVIPQRLAVAGL